MAFGCKGAVSSAKCTSDGILWVTCLTKQEKILPGSGCPVCQQNILAFYLRSRPSCASDGTEESFIPD